ncbi:MAG: hypothetical protein RRC34_07910 [Lentisphaeria bacterium]|nr:hypothetical protein [Lentisphaeria bacterium]
MKTRWIVGVVLSGLACGTMVFGQQTPDYYDDEYGSNEVESASGVSTAGTAQRATDEIIGTVLAPALRPAAMRAGEAPAFDSVNSLFRYEQRSFDGSDMYYNRYGLTLRGAFNLGAEMPVDVLVPIDRFEFSQDDQGMYTADVYNNTTVGILVTPRYYILSQEGAGVDLSIGVSGFYYHSFFDPGPFDDRDVLGAGPLIALRRDFEAFSVSGGVMMTRGWNLDGDKELTGHQYIDTYRGAVNVGVPIGENVSVNGIVTYTFIDDLPDSVEDRYFGAGVGATWVINGSWAVDAMVLTDLGNSDADNILAMIGFIWTF